MKPVLFLRTAAVLTLIHAVLHTIGGVFSTPEPGPQLTAVTAMKTNQFLLMGHVRSYWDFYMGMGLCATLFMTVEAVAFWQLASLAKTESMRLRPVYATFCVGFVVMAGMSYRYFFLGPVIVEILIAICLGLAFFASKAVPVRV